MTATRFCRIGVECPNNENAIYTPAKKKDYVIKLTGSLISSECGRFPM